jgi:hypothetical protein
VSPAKVAVLAAVTALLLVLHEKSGEYVYDEEEVKRWVLGPGGRSGNCDVCVDNADLGWIGMDDVFDGVDGDIDEPPAHPHCECTAEFKTKRVRVYV